MAQRKSNNQCDFITRSSVWSYDRGRQLLSGRLLRSELFWQRFCQPLQISPEKQKLSSKNVDIRRASEKRQ